MGLFFPEVLIGCERKPSKYFLEYIFQSGFMGLFTFQIKIPRELLGIQADMFNPFTSSPGESITIKKKKKKSLCCTDNRHMAEQVLSFADSKFFIHNS